MEEAVIKVRPNGPYLIEGELMLQDAAGQPIHPPKKPFSLCRCGGSKNKPFCDGSHKQNGFQG